MARWNKRIAYIDGFAGPGRYKDGEEGSPVIVLRRAKDFIDQGSLKPHQLAMTFVEADADRFEHLETEISALKNAEPSYRGIDVEVVCAKYAETMERLWERIGTARLVPTFAFIDPFGISHTPYSHLQKILSFPKTEVFVNLMYEQLNRFLGLAEWEPHLDELFGEPTWRALRDVVGAQNRRVAIIEYFRRRLRDAGAEYVLIFEMRNERDATDYLLFFATKSDKGLEVMKEAMWQVDRSGGFSFSDYTYSAGPMLIEPSPNYDSLQSQLKRHFDGQLVPIETIKRFVLASTSFFRFKSEALKPMEAAGSIEVVPPPGKRHRLGGYPDGSQIRFISD